MGKKKKKKRLKRDVRRLRSYLADLLRWAEVQECRHEETKLRKTYKTNSGGCAATWWEICSQCGAAWSDDEGGKPEYEEPAAIAGARRILELTAPPEVDDE
jgi:hypothetical protein